MKVSGIHVEYYMKNGQILTDDELRFVNPVDEKNKDYVELLEKIKNLVKNSFQANTEGHIVIGCLHVRTSEIQAVRILPIYDHGKQTNDKS